MYTFIYNYSGPYILRLSIQPEEHGIKLKVVLKLRYIIYVENIEMVSLMAGLKIEGCLKVDWS